MAYAVEERFVYRHKWTMGDLLMWDNRCLRIARTPISTGRFPRVLQRTCLSGAAPADLDTNNEVEPPLRVDRARGSVRARMARARIRRSFAVLVEPLVQLFG